MLIVSANLSSLQFARLSARQKELAVRVALGAGRGRLIRQTLTESLVLSLGGAIVGLGLTVAGTSVVSRLHAFDIPLLDRVGIDAKGRARRACRRDWCPHWPPSGHSNSGVRHDALKESNRGSTRSAGHAGSRRARRGGSGAACVLLVGAVCSSAASCTFSTSTSGIGPRERRRSASIRIAVSGSGGRERLLHDALARVRPIPGISGAALADVLRSTATGVGSGG
jgi:hypothetical protein